MNYLVASLVLSAIIFLLSIFRCWKLNKNGKGILEAGIEVIVSFAAIIALLYSINKDKDEKREKGIAQIVEIRKQERIDSMFEIIRTLKNIDNDTLLNIIKNYKNTLNTGQYFFNEIKPSLPSADTNNNKKSIVEIEQKDRIAGVEISIRKCELIGNKLICYVTYENISTDPGLITMFRDNGDKIIDENGNVYNSVKHTIANIESEKYHTSKYEIIRGTKVNGQIEFIVGDTNFNKLASLETITKHKFYNIPIVK